MARRIMGTMSHEDLHGLNNGGGDYPGTDHEVVTETPAGAGNPENSRVKFPGQVEAEKSGIPSPITKEARRPEAFQGAPAENTGRVTDLPSNGVLAPGPNFRVNRMNDRYLDRETGGPYHGDADQLDRELAGYEAMKPGSTRRTATGENLTREGLIEGFHSQHPKGDIAAVADDEGNDHGFVPISQGESDDALLEKFYKQHEKKSGGVAGQ